MRTRLLTKILLLPLCAVLLTGPLAVLQIGAWGWMLASYSQGSSFSQAVAETFSGERPCGMCKLIIEVEETEREQQPANTPTSDKDLKLMLGLEQPVQVPHPHVAQARHPLGVHTLDSIAAGVPTPPPRLV